jgi:hypothetical protein
VLQQFGEPRQWPLTVGIAEGCFGGGVKLGKDAIDAYGDSGAQQGQDVFAVSSGAMAETGVLHGVRGIVDDSSPSVVGYLSEYAEISHVYVEILSRLGTASFTQPQLRSTSAEHFVSDMSHVCGAQELAFLDEHWQPAAPYLEQQRALSAQKGWDLKGVHMGCHLFDLPALVDVSDDG